MPVTTELGGRLTPDAVEKFNEALAWSPEQLANRVSGFARAVYADDTTLDVPAVVDRITLRLAPLGYMRFTMAGRVPPPRSQSILSYKWQGYGVAIDGRPSHGAYLTYDDPLPAVPPGVAEVPWDWDLILPRHDMPALRRALKRSNADVQAKARGFLVFANAVRVSAPVEVAFDCPSALFSSVSYTGLRCKVEVPEDAAPHVGYLLAAVGLELGGQQVALTPLTPKLCVNVGHTITHTLET